MDISEFATKHNLKVRRDDCGDGVVVGSRGHIYDGFADGRLGVYLSFLTVMQWNNARRKLEAAGLKVKQNASTEGCLLFDPENTSQTRLVFKTAGITYRRRRTSQPSAAEVAAQRAFGERRKIEAARARKGALASRNHDPAADGPRGVGLTERAQDGLA